ncbi:MAG: aspartate dehydrogenase [Ruminococcus sp.]|nr:aspartate dehydrogenase [Ruminococcus sp.]
MKLFKHHGARRFETAFDPDKQEAVIRGSICTSEKVAGFKNKDDGTFTEVMLIHSYKDIERFKEKYGVDALKTEY